MQKYLEIAVAAPLHHTLTYAVPVDYNRQLAVGMRVLVPLANRLVTGYLLDFVLEKPLAYKIKSITDLLDNEPIFPANMVSFYRFIANYYQYPIGEVIKGALPCGITPQSGHQVTLTTAGKTALAAEITHKNIHFSWLAQLLDKEMLTPGKMRQIWRQPKARKLLDKWSKQGWLKISTLLTGVTVKAKTEICVKLSDNYQTIADCTQLKKSEQKTVQLLVAMMAGSPLPVARKDLIKRYSTAGHALSSLIAHKIVIVFKRQLFRDPFGEPPPFFPRPAELTQEQQTALDQLTPVIRQKKFTAFLLHGITGSGKTEIYLRAAEAALAEGRSVLVLVPEIALATQLEAHFFSRFGKQIALLHSGLSKGERFDQWQRLARGDAKIVLGARSAIFAPLKNPGLIIVDEEHDGAYKQEDGLRYQARDLAVLRGSMQQAAVILGSATPAVVSYYHARNGKYKLLELTKRIGNRRLPQVKIVNLREIATVSNHPPLFSPDLISAVKDNLANNEQSLIFLNRRGFANLMICKTCGRSVRCQHCDITLTLHKGRQELICHYCGYRVNSAAVCANCQSSSLVGVGFGTERLQEELVKLFPDAVIARLDRDTTVKRKDFINTLKAVHNRQIDILIGTQMITKGHHFPYVTLVGIVWADAGLGVADFKAGERTFQLLSQVAGRAGRGEKAGRVIVQTKEPEHYSIVLAQNHDYQALFAKELALRKSLRFPPFSRLINIRLEGDKEEQVKNTAMGLARTALQLLDSQQSDISILGPAPAPLSRLYNKYRWQLLLKGADIDKLHFICTKLTAEQSHGGKWSKGAVKLSVDVDPENML